MSIQKALPELPAEVWLDIFDKVGPTADIPCVCRYFKELYTTRMTRWAERIVDHLEDSYKEQSPARGIPRGSVVTYDQAKCTAKYFKNKIDAVRSQLSSDEQDRCKNASSLSLAVHPESLSTLLPMIDEIELVNLLHDKLPDHLRTAPRSEKMRALTARTQLDLSHNQLTTLPSSIGNLTALTDLDVAYNQLTTLPEPIGNLTALVRLYLSGNQLSILPVSFGNLTQLTRLNLTGNHLSTLPDFIGNLTQLTRLNLSFNQLSTLPDSFGKLTALTQLDLPFNQLTTLPDSFGNLTQLTELFLSGNRLTTLPDSFGNLTALRKLNILGNPSLARSPQSLIQLRRLRENGCEIDCDAAVDQAIKALPEIPGEPPSKKQKCLIQ